MRRQWWSCIVALALILVGCSTQEPMTVEFSHPLDEGGGVGSTVPFTAVGAPVDDGAVCQEGTHEIVRLETMQGEQITDDDWAEMFDSAMAEGSVAEMTVRETWTCDDGSGTFDIDLHNRYDFESFEFGTGQHDVGTWTIVSGTDDYDGMTGSGDITLDFDAGTVTWTGEIQAP